MTAVIQTRPLEPGAPSVPVVAARRLDRALLLVGLLALVLSLGSLLVVQQQQIGLLYYDSQARLLITRRVVDSPTPGLAQLGSVWLPLTHVLALPLIGIDPLYQSGLALTAVSMLSFFALALVLYQTVNHLTGERTLGVIAALILMTNPNLLYMQATPMTEVPMFAAMMLSVYTLLRLSAEPENRTWLFLSGLSLTLACLIRYEAWPLLLLAGGILFLGHVVRRFSYVKIEGLTLFWAYWAAIGIVAWIGWNWIIFGDPLSFQRGEYAKPSLWVAEGDPIIGNLHGAFWSYLFATFSTVGLPFFVGLLGAVVYAVRTRLRPQHMAPLAFYVLFPFFVFMLYAGQRPMRVPELSGDMYNIRFALVMLLPTAIFMAYLARRSLLLKALVIVIAAGSIVLQLRLHGIITLTEPASVQDTPRSQNIELAAAWLKAHYNGGRMLMESYGNDQLQFVSGIPLGQVVYEGSFRIWEGTLEAPQRSGIEWVVMRLPSSDVYDLVGADKVWTRWHNDPALEAHYDLVYANAFYQIYQRKLTPVIQPVQGDSDTLG